MKLGRRLNYHKGLLSTRPSRDGSLAALVTTNLVIVIIILVLTVPQRHTETDTYYITFNI